MSSAKELKRRLRKHMHSINTRLRQTLGYSLRKSTAEASKIACLAGKADIASSCYSVARSCSLQPLPPNVSCA